MRFAECGCAFVSCIGMGFSNNLLMDDFLNFLEGTFSLGKGNERKFAK